MQQRVSWRWNPICTSTAGSYESSCKNLFDGHGIECIDVNECAISNAYNDSSSTCFNSFNSFHCECNDGYQKVNHECLDINECELDLDFCDENALYLYRW